MHFGSAGFIESEMKGQQCDVLLLCVPGWKKADGYLDRLPAILKPEVIIPFHFDDFTKPVRKYELPGALPFIGMKEFTEKLSAAMPKTEIRLPGLYEEMRF